MFIYRLLLYSVIFYVPILMIYDGYRSSYVIPQEYTLWYQNFKDNPRFNLDLTIKKYPKFQRNYFQSDRLLAYFNKQGEITHKVFIDNQSVASVKNSGYIIFKKFGNIINFYNSNGKEKWEYTTFSYPQLSSLVNNIILVSTDNTIISMINQNLKEILPKIYLGTMITDIGFCQYNDSIAISTIDGNLFFFDNHGKNIFDAEITSSKINYIKSVQCSNSGEKIAVLSGLQPEKLILFNKNGKILWEQETQVERRTKTSIGIDEQNQLIYDQRENQIAILSLQTGKLIKNIEINPKLDKIRYSIFSFTKDYFIVGHNRNNIQTVTLYNIKGDEIWKKKFSDLIIRYVEILQINNKLNLLVILENGIYAYQLNLYI